jgi:hypothetical protein
VPLETYRRSWEDVFSRAHSKLSEASAQADRVVFAQLGR